MREVLKDSRGRGMRTGQMARFVQNINQANNTGAKLNVALVSKSCPGGQLLQAGFVACEFVDMAMFVDRQHAYLISKKELQDSEKCKIGKISASGALPSSLHCCQLCDKQGCGDCSCIEDDDSQKIWSRIQKAVKQHMEAGPFHTKNLAGVEIKNNDRMITPASITDTTLCMNEINQTLKLHE